ncbi:hypothetical protein [endosymbiont of Lamellibrachia barhami]|uniref:hypothetical protein n=1 Tax=endosymbiont of Lamellibrachia barhami TaxID=205975 RepID=UPI0015B22725|nr:hypothetical protein [endosymbiont of Lamellibrachia barhami]
MAREKGREFQAVRIIVKDNSVFRLIIVLDAFSWWPTIKYGLQIFLGQLFDTQRTAAVSVHRLEDFIGIITACGTPCRLIMIGSATSCCDRKSDTAFALISIIMPSNLTPIADPDPHPTCVRPRYPAPTFPCG